MLQKLKYFTRSITNLSQRKECPYCGHTNFDLVDSKYLVTTLLDCKVCHLYHRHPKDDPDFIKKFYQSDYTVDKHMITNLPSDEELKDLKSTNFAKLHDFAPPAEALLGARRGKVVDYGCSWGYSVYKLKNAGFDAVGFEISVPRAEFGRQKLGIDIVTNENDIRPSNDLIQSSHVIEHLLDIKHYIQVCRVKLKEDGIFVAYCPNGSREYREREPDIFHINWGFLHPNYLNVDFAVNLFKNNPHLILTGDWHHDLDLLRNWDGASQIVSDKRDGKELMIVAKPNVNI